MSYHITRTCFCLAAIYGLPMLPSFIRFVTAYEVAILLIGVISLVGITGQVVIFYTIK